jgi:hypothetical protein
VVTNSLEATAYPVPIRRTAADFAQKELGGKAKEIDVL